MKERSLPARYAAQRLSGETIDILIAEALNARKYMMRKGLKNLAETRSWRQPKKRAKNKTAVGSPSKYFCTRYSPMQG
jgi:hypothetical protein